MVSATAKHILFVLNHIHEHGTQYVYKYMDVSSHKSSVNRTEFAFGFRYYVADVKISLQWIGGGEEKRR